jgi:hypothetical protein
VGKKEKEVREKRCGGVGGREKAQVRFTRGQGSCRLRGMCLEWVRRGKGVARPDMVFLRKVVMARVVQGTTYFLKQGTLRQGCCKGPDIFLE